MKRVLVIGAGAYQIPLIQRLKELGHLVFALDGNPAAPGFSFADRHQVLDICNRELCLAYARDMDIDGVMTYGATITLPTVAYIGRMLNLPALPEETAELSKNKFRIKQRLYEQGLNTSGPFFCLHSMDEAKTQTFPLPCVIKPSDGSGSKGVTIVHREEELEDALLYGFRSARFGEIYVEPFIAGKEYSAEVFCGNGQAYAYAIVKTTFYRDSAGVLHYGHRVPAGLAEEAEQAIEAEVLRAVRALGVTMGSVNFDVILSEADGKPYIIDAGIRIGQNLIASHLVPLSRGVSELDAIIRLSLGQPAQLEPLHRKPIATRLLIYDPGRILRIRDFSHLIGKNHIVDVVLRKAPGDILNPYREKSDSCGWVIASGNSPEAAEANADAAFATLRESFVMEPQI